MSFEFKAIDNEINLFVISDADLDYFESAYFDVFNAKYNNLLDRYGTFRLYNNHLHYLESLLEKDNNKPTALQDLLIVIKQCLANGVVVNAIGD